MDFCSLQANMNIPLSFEKDIRYECYSATNYQLSDEYEKNEDDVLYVELRRQVLLLTADDDDDAFLNTKLPNVKRVIKKHANIAAHARMLPGGYFSWQENESTNSVPAWLLNLWRNGSGTGVFIPEIAKTTRRNKPRRKNNERGRMYKPVAYKSR
ncbi:hypothetical protein RJ640_017924 [Escallonia rubra]|uniref:Uncharacterized protein n=1 Tax=Escallonia rubra TaxID=112253 RepID=A0AA88QY24_9ASTE|nr:hypothetical protein RJ640_017924 [Escallonia rubra]